MSEIISIITPTFNCGNFIFRSYQCLLKQSYTNWEWLVIDDGSTDNTAEQLSNLASSDDRIKIFSLNKNYGRGFARDFALKNAISEIIVIWDVDDLYMPDRLSEIVKYLNNGYDYFCSYALVVDMNFCLKGGRHFDLNRLAYPDFVHPTLAFNKSCLGGISYDPLMRTGEDYVLMMSLVIRSRGFYCPRYLMIYFEDRQISIDKTIDMMRGHISGFYKLLKCEYLDLSFLDIVSVFVKFYLKFIFLHFLKIKPSLYLRTVKFRSKSCVDLKVLTASDLAFISNFYHE